MKAGCASRFAGKAGSQGFALLELLATIAIIAVLAALLLPAVMRSSGKAKQIRCLNNLRQIGVAMQNFAHEHGDRYPMQVPLGEGGSMEANREILPANRNLSFSARHFQPLAADLSTPQTVVCPADKRPAAANFRALTRTNISYWVNPRAVPGNSRQYLAGDWNVMRFEVPRGTNRSQTVQAAFSPALHEHKGNVLFADTHVELVRNIEVGPGSVAIGRPTPEPVTPDPRPSPPERPGGPVDGGTGGGNTAGPGSGSGSGRTGGLAPAYAPQPHLRANETSNGGAPPAGIQTDARGRVAFSIPWTNGLGRSGTEGARNSGVSSFASGSVRHAPPAVTYPEPANAPRGAGWTPPASAAATPAENPAIQAKANPLEPVPKILLWAWLFGLLLLLLALARRFLKQRKSAATP